jgi:hypothetical protein
MQSIIARVREQAAGPGMRPPVSAAEVEEAERQLGFPLPDLLRELYLTVGDGGFGPSYGVLPLLKPEPGGMGHESVVLLYALLRHDPSWPERLLPFLDWGCAIASCVDCLSLSLPVIRYEEEVFTPEAPSLEHWLNDWLAGRDLFRIPDGEGA